MTVTVLLGTTEPAHRAGFADAFHEVAEVEVVAFAQSAAELARALSRHAPDVVVLDDPLGAESAFEVARSVLARDPSAAILLWTDRETADVLQDALDSGLRGVITRPLSVDEATVKIAAAAEWSQRVRGPRAHDGESPTAGHLVAVFGAKGGVGTSTLAVQLARLATGPAWPCVLVDFDLGGGDLTALLDLSHQRSVLDLVPVVDHLNGRYLTDALYTHATGLRILPGPAQPERSDEITEPIARRVLGTLRAYFPFVVVDCGARLDDANAVALEIADQALLVVVPDVPCLLAARRQLATLSRLSIRSDDRMTVVVNRQSRRSEFQLPAIRRSLGIAVSDAVVPDHPAAFHAATNQADPAGVVDRGVVRVLRKLARQAGLLRADGAERPEPRHQGAVASRIAE